jgi:ABC-type iron transport system FetAB ATPase subunit
MNVLSIAIALEGTPGDYAAFEVQPDALYPAALADMKDAAARTDQLSSALRQIIMPVRELLTDANIALALTPKAEIVAGDNAAQVDGDLSARYQLLEAARLWFTEKLHQAINHAPMHLRILKGDGSFRL